MWPATAPISVENADDDHLEAAAAAEMPCSPPNPSTVAAAVIHTKSISPSSNNSPNHHHHYRQLQVDGSVTMPGSGLVEEMSGAAGLGHCHSPPVSILVGYAFGPKKMSTMGIIMAEASKASRYFNVIAPSFGYSVSSLSQVQNLIWSSSSGYSQQQQHVNSTASVVTRESCTTNTTRATCGSFTSSCTPIFRLGSQHRFHPTSNSRKSMRDTGGSKLRVPQRDGKLSSELVAKLPSSSSEYESTSPAYGTWCNNASNHSTVSCALSCTSTISSRTATAFFGNNSNNHHNLYSIKKPKINVSFVPVDLDSPLEEQHGGNFDVILHKMTEDILLTLSSSESGSSTPLERSADEVRAMKRLERLQEYKEKHNPTCYLVDSPERIKTLMCRADIATVLTKSLIGVTSKSGVAVRAPRFVVCNSEVNESSMNHSFNDDLAHQIDVAPFTYPLIAKPLTAAGTAGSHKLGIVLGREGLRRIETPCILQEYSNHDGALFKVYVLGGDVFVFKRPSLPNLPVGECCNGSSGSYVEFDSQRPYPKLADFDMNSGMTQPMQKSDWRSGESIYKRYKVDYKSFGKACSFLTEDEILPVVHALRKAFGLDLFGFDVLVTNTRDRSQSDVHSKMEILVVDVNYFPSYKEVSNFPTLLAKYLTQQAIYRRDEMNTSI